jgi:recombination DNA repair RAD52 pathway protein
MRITLKDGTYHEDIGYANVTNLKSKETTILTIKKLSITDGLKRTIRYFGPSLSNSNLKEE